MTQTLERLTSQLHQRGVEDEREIRATLHVAGMLAFVEAAHKVVNQTTMPTPLYRIQYDNEAHNVSFQTLNGRSRVPAPDALDMNMLDILVASLLKEKMPLLLEGKTGVGKTFTVEQFMKTVLPEANYRGLRLNQNMSNVLQPYTEGRIENGLVKIALKKEELDRVAALFIDEVNRGDTNQVLQLQDGVIRLSSGEGGELGIPVPRYRSGRWVADGEDKRPLFVVSAQNPPMTKDAKYSGTKRTDAAQGNRNLQIDVPNSAAQIGASVLLLETSNGQHRHFMQAYKTTLAGYLGIEPKVLDSLDQDWINVYAFATDPRKTRCPSIQSAVEFMDGMVEMVSPDLLEEFETDKVDIEDWNNALRRYGIDFKYDGQVTETATSMEKLRDIVNSFKEDVITRDIIKAKKLSDAISLVRRIKKSLATDDPVVTYKATPNYITVQDVASGFAIMLHDKQDKHDADPVVLIDTVLREYIGVAESFADTLGYKRRFAPNDRNMSVYHLAFQHAIQKMGKAPGVGQRVKEAVIGKPSNPYTTAFIRDVGKSVSELKRLEAGNEYRKPILARMIADLTTLAGFADHYSAELEPQFANATTSAERRKAFKGFYREQRGKSKTPDIYLHRLTRVLGV